MEKSKAIIVVENPEALRVAAASARISTQQGTAMDIFSRSLGDEKDHRLIDKVLSSGHKSVIEHQTFGIAFNDVSVLVEQFVIECRLASFTVKSRRYVDFGEAGWVCPTGLDEAQRALFNRQMAARFEDYRRLMELGVPKEDARFVLPYALRSNFFMTVNARELIGLTCAMLYGRGKGFAEIEALGAQLKAQFDKLYPGVIDKEAARMSSMERNAFADFGGNPTACEGGAEIVNAPKDAMALIDAGLKFTGRFSRENLRDLLLDARPRELELLRYTFRVEHISLACLTHFTRHRMVSLLVPPVYNALAGGAYVLPESVKAVPEALKIYEAAFLDQHRAAQEALDIGMRRVDLSYFAMSGHELDVLLSMNARELAHFMRLRTCSRAQWEIRGVAMKMLDALKAQTPEIYDMFGPSCRFGPCPEGRMSCGKPWKGFRNRRWSRRSYETRGTAQGDARRRTVEGHPAPLLDLRRTPGGRGRAQLAHDADGLFRVGRISRSGHGEGLQNVPDPRSRRMLHRRHPRIRQDRGRRGARGRTAVPLGGRPARALPHRNARVV